MPDTVPAMLEPGEFVIRKDAAEKIGMKNLEMLNNADRLESGTSAIDELIALSTLSGSQQMMGGGNVKKMPQSGYMQEGGSVDDPLEIDMRQRSNNVQAIGIARPDSDERILRDLRKMQEDIKLLQFVKPRYPKASSFNEYRRMKEESGNMMSMDEMMEVLNRAAGATQNKFKIPEMQDGGSTYTYGSGETSAPTLADLYEKMGVQPIEGQQREKFESLFTYDPSREETIVDKYQSNIESLLEGAGRALGQARMASQTGGAGFAGFGERERLLSESRSRIQEQGIRGLESAQRGMFEDIRTQRDKYMSDAMSALSELEGTQGTVGFTGREISEEELGDVQSVGSADITNIPMSPPLFTPFGNSPVSMVGTDGRMYTWSPESQSWQLQE
jgi:hypothetical protein